MPEFIGKVIWKTFSACSQIQTCTPLPVDLYYFVFVCVQCLLESPELRVWSSSVPYLNTSTVGTTVWGQASGQLHCGNQSTPILFFQTVFRHLFCDRTCSDIWYKVKENRHFDGLSVDLFSCILHYQKKFFLITTVLLYGVEAINMILMSDAHTVCDCFKADDTAQQATSAGQPLVLH